MIEQLDIEDDSYVEAPTTSLGSIRVCDLSIVLAERARFELTSPVKGAGFQGDHIVHETRKQRH